MKRSVAIWTVVASVAWAGCTTGSENNAGEDGSSGQDGTPADGTPADGTPSDGTPSDGTPSDGTPSDGSSGRDAGTLDGGSGMDAATGDAGHDAGAGIEFTVPIGGSAVNFEMPGGETVTFEFPASAGGQAISIAPTETAPAGFEASDFAGLIDLGPDGLTFSEPVRVRVGNGALMVLNFAEGASVPDPLQLSQDGQALLLTHFSTLALIDPNQSCQSTSGWMDDPDSQRCLQAGAATTYRHYGCKNYQYCYVIEAGCCVEPGDANVGCTLDAPQVTLNYVRTDSNGGQYPYCDPPAEDAGAACQPAVTSVTPSALTANGMAQEITLHGTCFAQTGTAFANYDQVLSTTWVSDTEVHATVPGAQLGAAGSLQHVGYVNPFPAGGYDWPHPSNYVSVTIEAAQAPACVVPGEDTNPGICRETQNGCECVMDYDPGTGYKTYTMTCSGGVCECKIDQVFKNDGSGSGVCNSVDAMRTAYRTLCCPYH